MPAQLVPSLEDAKMDGHGIAQIRQHVVESQGLSQTGPWKKWPTKGAKMADSHNYLHRAVQSGTRSSAPLLYFRGQLFEEFRQRAEAQQDGKPAEPHTHMRREPVFKPRFPQLTELHVLRNYSR